MKRIFYFLIVVVLMTFVAGCAKNFGKSNVTYMDVKAEDMINDYIRDVGIAETKYKGRNIQLTGKLLEKGQFKNSSNFYAVLASRYVLGREYQILVEYPVDKNEELNKLKYGDFVLAKGECVGVVPQTNPTVISVQVVFGQVADGSKVPTGSQTTTNNAPSTPTTRTGYITGTEVRIRAEGDRTGAILGHFAQGETVTILEVTEKWTKVQRYNGQVGWVSNDYCRMQ